MGYRHFVGEIFFDRDQPATYCDDRSHNGEDTMCSQKYSFGDWDIDGHMVYNGMDFSELGACGNPSASQPQALPTVNSSVLLP